MSVILELYQLVESTLEADATSIKTIGLWNNQFDNEESEKAKDYPAVYVEFTDITWATSQQTTGLGSTGKYSAQQDGVVVMTLHIGFWQLEDETLAYEEISTVIDEVYNAIQGVDADQINPMQRVGERQDVDHDNVIDWQLDFSTQVLEAGKDLTTTEDREEIAEDTISPSITRDLELEDQVIRAGKE